MFTSTLTLPLLADVILPPPPVYPASLFHHPDPEPPTALTPIVNTAQQFADAYFPTWHKNHSLRVYAFGVALAEHAGWTKRPDWDQQVWYLTALLHDIGWLQNSECCNHSSPDHEGSVLSFEIWGGIKARELLLEWGAPKRCADLVCEAIIRHTENDGTSGQIRLLTALMQLGPTHDFRAVLHGTAESYGRTFIHPETTANITTLYPRLGLIHHFEDVLKREIHLKPGCITEMWAPRCLAAVGGIQDYENVQGSKDDDDGGRVPASLSWLTLK